MSSGQYRRIARSNKGVSKVLELWPIRKTFMELLGTAGTFSELISLRKSTKDFKCSLYATLSKKMPPRWRMFLSPSHVVCNLFAHVAWGEMPFSGSVYFENFWPCLVWAASCNISASLPPQLVSVSKTMKTKFPLLISPVGHFLGGRKVNIGTVLSNSLKVSGVTVACSSKLWFKFKAVPLS